MLDLVKDLPVPDFTKPIRCGRRNDAFSHGALEKGTPDHWDTEPNGDHTCSYCGSLSEHDFFDILQHYANGDEGYRFSTTAKKYKFYANRPGVTNASMGGIKFYIPHGDFEHDMEVKNKVFDAAKKLYFDRIQEYLKNPTYPFPS